MKSLMFGAYSLQEKVQAAVPGTSERSNKIFWKKQTLERKKTMAKGTKGHELKVRSRVLMGRAVGLVAL